MTDAERRVWQMLRSGQMDRHKFRRQVPFGIYIVDFVCHEARLIIEVDGSQHDRSSPRERERSRFLQHQGYRILRFWNNEALVNPEGVYAAITEELRRHPSHPSPIMGPIMGEGDRRRVAQDIKSEALG
jgi:very-short-patch-repair endonuclease